MAWVHHHKPRSSNGRSVAGLTLGQYHLRPRHECQRPPHTSTRRKVQPSDAPDNDEQRCRLGGPNYCCVRQTANCSGKCEIIRRPKSIRWI